MTAGRIYRTKKEKLKRTGSATTEGRLLDNELIVSICFSTTTLLCSTNDKHALKVSKFKKVRKSKKGRDLDTSLKPYPAFVMPSKSQRQKNLAEAEKEKKKAKDGFFQDKSDQDDTLEKIESLRVEMSDKTRKLAKKNKKTV